MMPWNEFIIKSRGWNRAQEREAKLVRIVAYEVYTLKFLFGKRQPKSMDKFWPIGTKTVSKISSEHKKKFFSKFYEYKKAKNKE